uniref:Uncharacterized protein n=1 Tax=Oryza glaberrima TaxID=4538 RepID=I1QMX8_ORYGL
MTAAAMAPSPPKPVSPRQLSLGDLRADLVRVGRAHVAEPPAAPFTPRCPRHRCRCRVGHRPLRRKRPQLALTPPDREDGFRPSWRRLRTSTPRRWPR